MSVLIKGMEMPKSCAECPMGSVLYGYKCLAKNKQFDRYAFTSMQDWCPLIEIPPHGRLIDADALVKKQPIPELGAPRWLIEQAPTIIPAEEGEDG